MDFLGGVWGWEGHFSIVSKVYQVIHSYSVIKLRYPAKKVCGGGGGIIIQQGGEKLHIIDQFTMTD